MGSAVFDFLTESFLFRDSPIATEFSAISDREIRQELRRYREFCLSNLQILQQETIEGQPAFNVFSGSSRVSKNQLKQMAFYVDRYILQDPLFPLTWERNESTRVMNAFLGFEQHEIDRKRIASAVRYLKWLTPMVAANYVKLLPVSYLFEPPDQLPLYASTNHFSDLLPEKPTKFFRERVLVRSAEKVENGFVIKDRLTPGRHISVEFQDHPDGMHYSLFAPEFSHFDEDARTCQARLTLPDQPPSAEEFETWVNQSIHRAAASVHDRIASEVYWAERCNARYLTLSRLAFDLLQVETSRDLIETNPANLFLHFRLPAFTNANPERLMTVRTNEGEAFYNFRTELDRRLRELTTDCDASTLRIKTKNIMHELSEVQVRTVDSKVRELRRSLLLNAAVIVGSLATSIQTSGLSWGAAWVAAANAVKSYTDYRRDVRTNRAFFLWNVLK